MCGACGSPVGDWSTFLVSGARRREDVARFLTTATRRSQVRRWHDGWVVSSPTGRSVVESSLEEVVRLVARHATPGGWDHVMEHLRLFEGEARSYDDPYAHQVPALPERHCAWDRALSCRAGNRIHLRLTAFLLGLSLTAETETVALIVADRVSPFTLVGTPGHDLTLCRQAA